MADKKNKKRKINWDEINEKISSSGKKNFSEENGYSEKEWIPKLKEDGTHESIIRFLPRPENDIDSVPYVQLFNHGFKGDTGQWFIENCPTTIGGDCPVCKANTEAWNEGDEETARKRSRKKSFFANVLIVKDPQIPANNGKVFIYRFGIKIMEKVMAKLNPKGEIDEPIKVFDFDEGANFKLKIKKKGQWNNYDSSEFAGVTTAIGDDDFINSIDNQLHTLDPIVSPDKFSSYEKLEENFKKKSGIAVVINRNVSEEQAPQEVSGEDSSESLGDESIFESLRKEAEDD